MKALTPQEKEVAGHLKATVWYTVSKIVEQEVKKLSEDNKELNRADITVTHRFTAALVELVYRQIVTVGEDLELFASHAKRKIIRPDDLYMVTRRNDVLTELIQDHVSRNGMKRPRTRQNANGSSSRGPASSSASIAEPEHIELDDSDQSFDDDDDDIVMRI